MLRVVVKSILSRRAAILILLLIITLGLQITIITSFDKIKESFTRDVLGVAFDGYPFDVLIPILLSSYEGGVYYFEERFGIQLPREIKELSNIGLKSYNLNESVSYLRSLGLREIPFFYQISTKSASLVYASGKYNINLLRGTYTFVFFNSSDFYEVVLRAINAPQNVSLIIFDYSGKILYSGIYRVTIENSLENVTAYLITAKNDLKKLWTVERYDPGPMVFFLMPVSLYRESQDFISNLKEVSSLGLGMYFIGVVARDAKIRGLDAYMEYISSIEKALRGYFLEVLSPKKFFITNDRKFYQMVTPYLAIIDSHRDVVAVILFINYLLMLLLAAQASMRKSYDLVRIGIPYSALFLAYLIVLVGPVALVGSALCVVLKIIGYQHGAPIKLLLTTLMVSFVMISLLLRVSYASESIRRLSSTWMYFLIFIGALSVILAHSILSTTQAFSDQFIKFKNYPTALTAAMITIGITCLLVIIIAKIKAFRRRFCIFNSIVGTRFSSVAAAILVGICFISVSYATMAFGLMYFSEEISWRSLGADMIIYGDADMVMKRPSDYLSDYHVLIKDPMANLFFYEIKDAHTDQVLFNLKGIDSVNPESIGDYINSDKLPNYIKDSWRKVYESLRDDTIVVIAGTVNLKDGSEILIRAVRDFMGTPLNTKYVKLKVKLIEVDNYITQRPELSSIIITNRTFEKITNIFNLTSGHFREEREIYVVVDESLNKDLIYTLKKSLNISRVRLDIVEDLRTFFKNTIKAINVSYI